MWVYVTKTLKKTQPITDSLFIEIHNLQEVILLIVMFRKNNNFHVSLRNIATPFSVISFFGNFPVINI